MNIFCQLPHSPISICGHEELEVTGVFIFFFVACQTVEGWNSYPAQLVSGQELTTEWTTVTWNN